jgi:signal transduction histidine kinase
MHSGRVELIIEDNDLYIDLIVRDNGVGIPEDELPYIFEKFYKGKDAGNETAVGVGMGLAITKTLVTAMGGKIWAQSKPGKGSEFRVMLPRRLFHSNPSHEDSTEGMSHLSSAGA